MYTISHMPSAAEVHEAILAKYEAASPTIVDAGVELLVSVSHQTEPPTVSVVSMDAELTAGYILDGLSVRVSDDGHRYEIPQTLSAEQLALTFLKRHLGC